MVKAGNDLRAAVTKKTATTAKQHPPPAKPTAPEVITKMATSSSPPTVGDREAHTLKRNDAADPNVEKARKKTRMVVAATKRGAAVEERITRVELHEEGVPGALSLFAGETRILSNVEKSAEEVGTKLKELLSRALKVANDIVGQLEK